jgi:hypothetical protein
MQGEKRGGRDTAWGTRHRDAHSTAETRGGEKRVFPVLQSSVRFSHFQRLKISDLIILPHEFEKADQAERLENR